MKTLKTVAKLTLIVLALTIALVIGQVSRESDLRQQRSAAYESGITEMIQSISDCSLEDAHAEKCFIPCSTDTDCLAKNGMRDH